MIVEAERDGPDFTGRVIITMLGSPTGMRTEMRVPLRHR